MRAAWLALVLLLGGCPSQTLPPNDDDSTDAPSDDDDSADDDDTVTDDDDTVTDDDDTADDDDSSDDDDTADDDDSSNDDDSVPGANDDDAADDDDLANDDDTVLDDDDTVLPNDDDTALDDDDTVLPNDDDTVLDDDDTVLPNDDDTTLDDDDTVLPNDDDTTLDDDDTVLPDDDDTVLDDDDATPAPAGFNLCGVNDSEPRATGTEADPIEPPWLPMVDPNDTLTGQDIFDTYDCAPTTGEYGPEILYRFTADHPGDFHAELIDGAGVDIDLHLLQNPTVSNGVVSGCLGRAHEVLDVPNLPAGEYWLVADSWSNSTSEFPGAYALAFEWISDNVWNEVPVRDGVTWSRMRRVDANGTQTLNVLDIDPATHDLQPWLHAGCQFTQTAMQDAGAFAGINANFYNTSTCVPTDLLKGDGTVHTTGSTTGLSARTLGWNAPTATSWDWIAPSTEWPAMANAVGGHPSLVNGGVAFAEVQPGQQVYSSTDWGAHPRTAVGITGDGRWLMVTFDGRTSAGAGLTTPALAQEMADLGAVDALNLDGGGSTTMVVENCWLNHVVNYPSDNGAADHHGTRGVASGLLVR